MRVLSWAVASTSTAANSACLEGKCLYSIGSEQPAARAISAVPAPWKPCRAKTVAGGREDRLVTLVAGQSLSRCHGHEPVRLVNIH